jgi:uncharacterized membrane protein
MKGPKRSFLKVSTAILHHLVDSVHIFTHYWENVRQNPRKLPKIFKLKKDSQKKVLSLDIFVKELLLGSDVYVCSFFLQMAKNAQKFSCFYYIVNCTAQSQTFQRCWQHSVITDTEQSSSS